VDVTAHTPISIIPGRHCHVSAVRHLVSEPLAACLASHGNHHDRRTTRADVFRRTAISFAPRHIPSVNTTRRKPYMTDKPASSELTLDELDTINGRGILEDLDHAVQTLIHLVTGNGPITSK
jgi:hypothetical protein